MISLRNISPRQKNQNFILKTLSLFDWPQTVFMFLLITVGLFFIYSIGRQTGGAAELFWTRQLRWLILGIAVWLGASLIDYRRLKFFALPFYLLCLGLLVLVLVKGTEVFGARRWLVFGSLRLQPSEPAKIATIILIAAMMSLPRYRNNNFLHLGLAGLIMMLPFLLVVLEPDLGSAMVLLPVGAAMVFVAGIKWRYILILSAIILVIGSLEGLNEVYRVRPFLKDYQRKRIEVFLNPEKDPWGSGYNQLQSRLAVGSGGMTGKGYGNSSQSTLGFLPRSVSNNDFIFSVIAEEAGFVGCSLLIFCYLLLLATGLRTAMTAGNVFGRLLAAGITTLFFTHIFVNIGMTVGLLPVTGLPLPLLSYGGSFLVSSMFCLGLLQSIRLHRSEEDDPVSTGDGLFDKRARLARTIRA
jgi:rod shape determining protein RodA